MSLAATTIVNLIGRLARLTDSSRPLPLRGRLVFYDSPAYRAGWAFLRQAGPAVVIWWREAGRHTRTHRDAAKRERATGADDLVNSQAAGLLRGPNLFQSGLSQYAKRHGSTV